MKLSEAFFDKAEGIVRALDEAECAVLLGCLLARLSLRYGAMPLLRELIGTLTGSSLMPAPSRRKAVH